MTEQELNELIERSKRVVMSAQHLNEQRISFVFGNLAIDNPEVTRTMVRKECARLLREQERKDDGR